MQAINHFKAKTLARDLKKSYNQIIDVSIITETNRFVFIFKIQHNDDIVYNFISVNRDDFNYEDLKYHTRVAVEDICFSTTKGFSEVQTLQQYQLRYFFYTGRYIQNPSYHVQKCIKENSHISNFDFKINEVIVLLSKRSEDEFNNAEWQYFKDSVIRTNIVIDKCGTCEEEKILRDEDEECCDICQDCYDRISYARDNVMQRTVAAVGYLNGTCNDDPKAHMSAFLSIFHPELSKSKRDMLIREAQ